MVMKREGREQFNVGWKGVLSRRVCGLSGMEDGFPAWVYVYGLAEQ